QKPGSSIARVVVQLKGEKNPIIQKEGNTLLIIPASGDVPVEAVAEVDPNEKLNVAEGLQPNEALSTEPKSDLDMNIDYSKGGTPEAYPKYEMAEETKNLLLNARTLEEFLLKHRKYYGKPISIQVDNTGIKDVLEMIGEEAGLNLALPNQLGGNISLKLRKVPWDQAFILILKSNGLGYVREGNVIRVDSLQKLGQEIENAQAIIERRNIAEPLQIKIIPVSYLNLTDAESKLKTLSTPERGSVLSDTQTNSLIVTDVEDNILKMEKLLEALDVPPKQVLIEGKVIEAVESFSQGLGVNWTASGASKTINETGGLNGSPLRVTPSLSVSPAAADFGGIATLGLQVGTLDVLGNLNAKIALLESNNLAKVVSSPRIITLTGEAATFSQTLAVPVIKQKTTTDSTSGLISTEEVATQDFTLNFKVTPVITADNSVRLDLNVARTNPTAGSSLSGGQVTTSSSSATTKVLVGNNQTAVIGGIYSGSETSSERKVPVLGDIPILGWLFKSKGKENTKTELVVFVTPRIISSERLHRQSMSRKVKDDVGLETSENDSDSNSENLDAESL
ncbi:MAG: type IV pilus secretin PilQ, partial [Bdellovibrionales bacterium]|nr:type IV pilus secretin PilQ [Bdellovibrionales bacterium]